MNTTHINYYHHGPVIPEITWSRDILSPHLGLYFSVLILEMLEDDQFELVEGRARGKSTCLGSGLGKHTHVTAEVVIVYRRVGHDFCVSNLTAVGRIEARSLEVGLSSLLGIAKGIFLAPLVRLHTAQFE